MSGLHCTQRPLARRSLGFLVLLGEGPLGCVALQRDENRLGVVADGFSQLYAGDHAALADVVEVARRDGNQLCALALGDE